MRNELGFPESGIQYPKEILLERDRLLREMEEEKAKPNFRKKLILLSEALRLLAAQQALEAALKIKSLERVAMNRRGRLLHD